MRPTRVCRWRLHFSGGKKSRPEEWHGNKLCSNTTQKRGKRASALERVAYEFCSGARIPQGLPKPGHGIAAMSKAMPSVRATATAEAHFPKDRHQAAPSSCSRESAGDLCESEPRAFSSERTASLSIHFSLPLAGRPSGRFPGIRAFGQHSFSTIWAIYSPKTWTGRKAKSTSISERGLWVCCLAIGGLTSPFDIRAIGLRGAA